MPRPRYPKETAAHGTHWIEGGEEKNSQPLSGLEPPIIKPVAQRYTTEISRRNFPLGILITVAFKIVFV
jgi:hypothetical protein